MLCTISASGMKYPPLFLAKGKSPLCKKQFSDMESDNNDYELFYSPGGNTDENTMIYFLNLVHKWVNKQECALILDRYSSHITCSVVNHAKSLGIRLVYIPTSATEMFQPLDVRVFGAMKSKGSKEFNNFVLTNSRGFTKSEAADIFIKCWKSLSIELINKSWNLDDVFEEENISDFTYEEDMLEDIDFNEELDNDDLLLIKENENEEKSKQQPLTPPRRY